MRDASNILWLLLRPSSISSSSSSWSKFSSFGVINNSSYSGVTAWRLRTAAGLQTGGGRGTRWGGQGGRGEGVVVEGIYEDIKMCIGPPAQSGAYTHYTSSLPLWLFPPPSVENLRVEGEGGDGRDTGGGYCRSRGLGIVPCLIFSRVMAP